MTFICAAHNTYKKEPKKTPPHGSKRASHPEASISRQTLAKCAFGVRCGSEFEEVTVSAAERTEDTEGIFFDKHDARRLFEGFAKNARSP